MNNLDTMKKVIGNRIKDERKKIDLTQGTLAKKIGKSLSNVSGYETGDRLPPTDVIYQLADIFECTTDYLLGRSPHRDYRIDKVKDGENTYHVGVHKNAIRSATIDDVIQLISELKDKN